MCYFIISLFSYFIYFNIKLKKVMHMFQQNRYHLDSYTNWLKNNFVSCFISLDLIFLTFTFLIFINYKLSTIIFFLIYLLLFLLNRKDVNRESKKPLVITARIKRMYFTLYLIFILFLTFLLLNFDIYFVNIYYLILGLILYLLYLLIILINFINIPVEKGIFVYYKNKAKNKLKSMKNTKVIGITGSYGKTSSKNIVNDILNIKYNSFPTPKNYNTPNGLMLTINNHLDKFNDYFIAEMGACRVGEIKELCDLVHPTYGILTKIGTAHLETFLTQENIQKTKFELIESLPSDGIAILNGDDELQINYQLKNNVKVLWVGIENKNVDVLAQNIVLSNKGTKFTCVFKDDKNKYEFETKLLGKANIYNILSGIALGRALGIGVEQLIYAVKKVEPVEHRLELKKVNDIYIIDDAYNANPVGSKMALDVLSMMNGKKIIVTPGMIELGSEQDDLNKEFGKYMNGKVDEVILIGKKATKFIYDGLVESEFDMSKVHILNDVKDAFELIKKLRENTTYVLLENDLPDLFNERS